jgi:trehalose/maltose transport system substrate-binding protein
MELEGAVRRAYSRRAFLLGAVSATTAGVLAACSSPSAAPTSAPAAATSAPAPTKPAAAAASPAGSPAASPAAAASAAPSPAAAASAVAKPSAAPAAAASPSAAAVAAATPSVGRTDAPSVPANILTAAKQYSGQTIVYYGDGVGVAGQMEQAASQQFAKDTGINITFTQRPQDSTEALALYQRFFQGQSSDIDAFSIDVVWPGTIAQHLVDLTPVLGDDAKQHYPGIVQNNTVDGHLVAMPYFSDFGMLFYRKDLLQKYGFNAPPQSWDELNQQAQKIVAGEKSANPTFAGFVFQGKAYEGLTCNALEWIASSGGGTIVDQSNKVTVNNPQAVAILNTMKGWIGNVVPQGVTSYQEEDARQAFQGGNAAFMRNWPYAYSLGQSSDSSVAGKFDVGPLPSQAGGKPTGTIGGWGQAVSKYSKVQDAAIRLVQYFCSPEVQKWRAIAGSFVPTIPTIASDPAVIAVQPYLQSTANVERVGRPTGAFGDNYNQASTAFFQGVSQILAGGDAGQNLADVQSKLQRLLA